MVVLVDSIDTSTVYVRMSENWTNTHTLFIIRLIDRITNKIIINKYTYKRVPWNLNPQHSSPT